MTGPMRGGDTIGRGREKSPSSRMVGISRCLICAKLARRGTRQRGGGAEKELLLLRRAWPPTEPPPGTAESGLLFRRAVDDYLWDWMWCDHLAEVTRRICCVSNTLLSNEIFGFLTSGREHRLDVVYL